MFRKLAAIACVLLPAFTWAADVQPQGSALDNAVATFISSNIKLSIRNAIADIRAMGLDCDSASVEALVRADMQLPYDSEAHTAASNYIETAVDSVASAASADMLAAAAAAPGAVVLPSGVVIQTLVAGDGPMASPGDVVELRYVGMLPDGSVFDAIEESQPPLRAPLTELTDGMAQALLAVPSHGHYIFTLPAATAYGSEGIEGIIPPECTLSFEVTTFDIVK